MNRRQKKKLLNIREKCPSCGGFICITGWIGSGDNWVADVHLCENDHQWWRRKKYYQRGK